MQTKAAEDILKWVRSTDLIEVRWESGGLSVHFRLADGGPAASPASAASFAAPALQAVPSPAVGVFRWAPPGEPRQAEEGKRVVQGTRLGLVEGVGPLKEVPCPRTGVLFKVCVEEGQAVQYGQPLFLLK